VIDADGAAHRGVSLLFLQPRTERTAAYPHRPGDATIKIWLDPFEVAKSRGFRAHEIGGIVAMVADNLREAWHEYFG
jgi:hypothetical protein